MKTENCFCHVSLKSSSLVGQKNHLYKVGMSDLDKKNDHLACHLINIGEANVNLWLLLLFTVHRMK